MDRRMFFKTLLSASALTPLLLASREPRNSLELFMIGDEPQNFISLILSELNKTAPLTGRSYAFLSPHPQKDALSRSLEMSGWHAAKSLPAADLRLSFSRLGREARPSFTLVRDGSVFDIRSRRLMTLWREMGLRHPNSTGLTTASLFSGDKQAASGRVADIYRNGARISTMSLNKRTSRTFSVRQGQIHVKTGGGRAWIEESCCRHKICCLAAPVHTAGERIICAPNHFVLAVRGSGGVDTVIG